MITAMHVLWEQLNQRVKNMTHKGSRVIPVSAGILLAVAVMLAAQTTASASGLVGAVLLQTGEADAGDWILFLGRFHPLLVHFPIGLLLFAVLLEFLSRMKSYEGLGAAVPVALMAGAITGLASGVTGYMLSTGGGYGEPTLGWHKWLGIASVLLAFLAWGLRQYALKHTAAALLYRPVLVVMALVVSVAGHFGGSLTHGSDYLFRYMPQPLKTVFNFEFTEEDEQIPLIAHLDSAYVYRDIIQPIFETRCVSCHNADRSEGNYLMTSLQEVLAGGDGGAAVVQASAQESELYRRLLLPDRDEHRMPPRSRRQLTNDQIHLIRWWIDLGMPSDGSLYGLEIEEHVLAMLNKLTVDGQPFFSRTTAPNPDERLVEQLNGEGYIIYRVSENLPFLQVTVLKSFTGISVGDLERLLPLAPQITWVDLARTDIGDEHMEVLGRFFNLTRLNLAHTRITDEGMATFASLPNLEYLNLLGTAVTDDGMVSLESVSALRDVYLWQTGVSDRGAHTLAQALPNVQVHFRESMWAARDQEEDAASQGE